MRSAILARGERVVVHAKKAGGSLTAVMVKIGGAPAGGHKGHGAGHEHTK